MPLTPLNVDDRTFDDLVAEAKRRIVAYTPEWTDFNESDPGITLVQLFAWLTETMLFRLNRVPDERMYVSFLNLVGFGPSPAVPATAIIEVKVAPGSGTTTVAPFELRLSAPGKDDDIPFEADAPVPLVGAALAVVLVDDGVSLARFDATKSIETRQSFQPLGPTRISGRALYLGLDATPAGGGAPLLVEPGNTAVLQLYVDADEKQNVDSSASTSFAKEAAPLDGDLNWEGKTADGTWLTLEIAGDETRGLHQSGFLRLKLPGTLASSQEAGDPGEKPRFWLRARATDTATETRSIHSLRLNAVRVRQWRTYAQELLSPGSDGTPNQTRAVRHPPILRDPEQPAIVEVNQPDVGGELVWTAWTQVDELATRDLNGRVEPGDRALPVFVVEPDGGGVRFGDGLNGLIPLRGPNNLRVTYRSGGGSQGNVAPGKLSLDSSLPNVDGIEQVDAATGGADEESVSSATQEAPGRLRSLERAVTAADFETLAREKAGVARATSLNRYHPLVPTSVVTGAITLVVVPPREGADRAPVPSRVYLDAVANALEPYRVLTTELFVVGPRYRAVKVDVEVEVRTLADAASVRNDVDARLDDFFDPLTGGASGVGWPLGGSIVYGEVLGVVLGTPRVAGVRSLVVSLDGVAAPSCQDIPLEKLDLVASTTNNVRVFVPDVKRQ